MRQGSVGRTVGSLRWLPCILASVVAVPSCDEPTRPLPQLQPFWSVPIPGGGPNFWDGDPAADSDIAVFALQFPSKRIVAVDAQTGALRWSTPLAGWVGIFEHLVLTPTLVVFASANRVGVFDRATGAPVWDLTYPSIKQAAWSVVAGGAVLTSVDWSIRAFDLATGAPRWRYQFQPDSVNGAISAMAVSGDTVYASAGQSSPAGLQPTAIAIAVRLSDGAELRRNVAPEPERGRLERLTIAGRLLVAGDFQGGVQAFDRFTGQRVWRTLGDPCCAGVGSAPVVYDGVLFYVAGDETATALDLPSGQVRWRMTGSGSFIPQPAACGRHLFANSGLLYKCALSNGAVAGIALNGDEDAPSSGFATNGTLAFVAGVCKIYAFRCD